MGLDVRLPIGLLFTAIGLALSLFGLTSDPALYERSLGINVNLIWGAVLLVFGAIMLLLGWRGGSSPARRTADAGVEERVGRHARNHDRV